MVEIARDTSWEDGRRCIAEALDQGEGLDRFQRMVRAQGGDLGSLPVHDEETQVLAESDGFVRHIDGLEVGLTGVGLGAGRTRSDQDVDPVVGIRIDSPRGEPVQRGQSLATILHRSGQAPSEGIVKRLKEAFTLGSESPDEVSLVLERIG
jgi:thymidine phosphorylase